VAFLPGSKRVFQLHQYYPVDVKKAVGLSLPFADAPSIHTSLRREEVVVRTSSTKLTLSRVLRSRKGREMHRIEPYGPLKLSGFNNLTKCLSFNLYDFCIARNDYERKAYVDYVQKNFSAEKITGVLKGICDIIEAKVLAVSDQDYDPWGASSLVLMSDIKGGGDNLAAKKQAMHLDKSHICAHTYPDIGDHETICSFRVDIDIATCGDITPLRALNYMFKTFESDVVVIDYVVRGFTRDHDGRRIYIDHRINSIQEYIDQDILKDYHCIDLILHSENIWQTKMLRTNQNEASYFLEKPNLQEPSNQKILEEIRKEMRGLVYMWPD
jgi:S-adenosylmethionine decarboxylase